MIQTINTRLFNLIVFIAIVFIGFKLCNCLTTHLKTRENYMESYKRYPGSNKYIGPHYILNKSKK